MSVTEVLVPAGKLFCCSAGEYSDYGYTGHYLALEDITRTRYNEIAAEVRLAEKAKEAEADAKGDWYFTDQREAFQAALIRAGLVMAITCIEVHLGSYSELDDVPVAASTTP